MAVARSEDARTPADDRCVVEPIGDVAVASVEDGRTFATADHRDVRLQGLEVAPPESPAGEAAKAALAALIGEKTVMLKRVSGAGEDRYGRLIVYAYVPGAKISVQQQLIATGYVYAASRIGPKPCAAALFSAEATARADRRGLWADPASGLLVAENPQEIQKAKGNFRVVEGKVLSVRESGATIYINFGRRFTRDFSVAILRRNVRPFVAAGIAPKTLQDKRIRVRGVIEERGGPLIEAVRPEQIELVE